MGLGGFLAGKTEIEHYDSERRREYHEVETVPLREEQEIIEIFEPYGLTRKSIEPMLEGLRKNTDQFVDFMMKVKKKIISKFIYNILFMTLIMKGEKDIRNEISYKFYLNLTRGKTIHLKISLS